MQGNWRKGRTGQKVFLEPSTIASASYRGKQYDCDTKTLLGVKKYKLLKTNIMERTKKLWFRAIAGVTLALAVGLVIVNASQNKIEAKEVKEIVPEVKSEKLGPIYKWYPLKPTDKATANQQELASDQPMLTAPPSGTGTNCAQNNNTGDYCAVLVEFAPGTTDFTLSDQVKLDVAISGNPDAIGVANQTGTPDPNGDGYSRHPSI